MTSKVLTVEFTFLGERTRIAVEGDEILADKLDSYMFRHLNKDSVIVDKDRSDSLYNHYIHSEFNMSRRGKNKIMFYTIES